ncbi:MAG: hypothetical protein D6705_11000 [Deltaproteobacteria bacterium]|nr:MAG: hypothetical protein D6705_11000 [Deltaproteobacteria bacterium]
MTTLPSATANTAFGGLLLPLDAFRTSTLAAVLGEALAARARDITDAELVLTRHPSAALVMATIEGKVVGDDPAAFWRENAELALVASQVLPREVFLVYAKTAPSREEAFLVAGQGQMLGADEANAERLGPNAPEDAWPIARLCAQIGIAYDDLAAGFSGGPAVRVSLVEPRIDDRQALMILAGQAPPEDTGTAASGPPPSGEKDELSDEARRRKQKEAEARRRQEQAEAVGAHLAYAVDDLGVVVAPEAELDDTDIIGRYVVHPVGRDLPPGLPRDLASALEGKRIDVVVPVSFLSEVFVGNRPLDKATWQAEANPFSLGGRQALRMAVHAPRLGQGTLIEVDGKRAFLSRTPDMLVPEAFVLRVLGLTT